MNSAHGHARSGHESRPSVSAGKGRRASGTRGPGPSPKGAARGSGGRTDVDRRRRELSQNYLRSPEAARQFLRLLRLDPAGLCIEVGAGEGILTSRLAAMTGEVIAYEIDQALAGRLIARVGERPNVRVVTGDFLASRQPSRPFQVVGNAPFSLTSPIIDWCLRATRMTAATLITQLEYARKRTGGYGRWTQLTVSSWPLVRWDLRGTIARTEFRPVPRVDAGVLRLERRAEPLISPARMGAYRRLVQAGFSGVGGSVHASLRRFYPADKVAAAFALAGVDRRVIVAYVSPDQWVQIFLSLDAGHPARKPSRPQPTARAGPRSRMGPGKPEAPAEADPDVSADNPAR
ncbi:MAG TPA: ErmE/ErmH/ErmO/ErmR family 23S rRNA (adenine(2058)-N(6))-methyltransferase [Streptosporangiaceae bacterium]|nr:ErmE/ErmH/ErmO/ErmR family 23S rRNA (adenine(2058)-N(6))-methyltransferase [Streptosporangiaceae bacterium]